MARYRKRRYRRKSSRYSANILDIARQTINSGAGDFFGYVNLTTNPVQSVLTVSQTYTVKRFSIDMNVSSDLPRYLEAITAYIMYLPQGMTITNSYHIEHPEYIMAYKYLGDPQLEETSTSTNGEVQQFQPTRIRSRLARKLQSGDSVILFVKGYCELPQGSAQFPTLFVSGLVRWWTKAN